MQKIFPNISDRFWIDTEGDYHQLVSESHESWASQHLVMEQIEWEGSAEDALIELGWIRVGTTDAYAIWEINEEAWVRLLKAIPPILKAYDCRHQHIHVDIRGTGSNIYDSLQGLRGRLKEIRNGTY